MFNTVNESLMFNTVNDTKSLMFNTVNDSDFGAKISEPIHSEYDISSSSAHLNSFENIDSISMSIIGSDITVGIDSGISLETCAPVRKCVDAGYSLGDSMEEIPLPHNSTPHKVKDLTRIHKEVTQIEMTHLHENLNKPPSDLSDSTSSQENAIAITNDANEVSMKISMVTGENTMPLLEQIPLISDDIVTPNLSQVNDLEISWTEQELCTMNIGTGSKEKDVEDILVSVGYSPAVVEEILSSIKKGKDVKEKDVENRPLTQIFTQGEVLYLSRARD